MEEERYGESWRLRRDHAANGTASLMGPHGRMNVALSELASLKAERILEVFT